MLQFIQATLFIMEISNVIDSVISWKLIENS